MSEPIMLSTAEAAEYLRLSARTLEKFRVTGGGPPYYKLGRLVKYLGRDLDRWIVSGRRTSTSDPGAEVPRDSVDPDDPLHRNH